MVWLKLLAVIAASVLLVWSFPFLWEIGVAAIFGACFWLFARPPQKRSPADNEQP